MTAAAGTSADGVPAPRHTLGLVTFVVLNYDEAIDWFTRALRFTLSEDKPLGGGKRWVVVTPADGGTGLLLARAADEQQFSRCGDQTGGRVAFFLDTADFDADHRHMRAEGVQFIEDPRDAPYGRVAVFVDLYGNRWDLLQRHPVKA